MGPARRPPDPSSAPPTVRPESRLPRAEMLLRDLVLRRGCCWPSLLLHCALHPLWGFVQVSRGCRGLETSRARPVAVGCHFTPRPQLSAAALLIGPGERLGKEKMLGASPCSGTPWGGFSCGRRPAGQGLGQEGLRQWLLNAEMSEKVTLELLHT